MRSTRISISLPSTRNSPSLRVSTSMVFPLRGRRSALQQTMADSEVTGVDEHDLAAFPGGGIDEDRAGDVGRGVLHAAAQVDDGEHQRFVFGLNLQFGAIGLEKLGTVIVERRE